ncbi:MAG: universal stress protein [Polyangiaceae bacterium]|nr:universal stress protein [Polyangiaceae bacterium]
MAIKTKPLRPAAGKSKRGVEPSPPRVTPPKRPRARKRILLALFESGRPTPTLQRAAALARTHGAELHVLRVVPSSTAASVRQRAAKAHGVTRDDIWALRALRDTRAWLATVLGETFGGDRLTVRIGTFVEQVSATAIELGADMIVVPPRPGRLGTIVTSIVRAAQVPVLVARKSTSEQGIVAATDLARPDYPVLRKAVEFGARVAAPVVAIHNVSPGAPAAKPPAAGPRTADSRGDKAESRTARLTAASQHLGVHADLVVAGALNPVDAILGEARARNARWVVVGTRPRSWFGRTVSGSVAAQVVNRARRSVLVTPLPADPSSVAGPAKTR